MKQPLQTMPSKKREKRPPQLIKPVIDEKRREVRLSSVGNVEHWSDRQWLEAISQATALEKKYTAKGYKVFP
ncbi:MAG TPA: hypothetical protein VMW52_12795 [Phycisphaerae bacterium]|nr:hypothetical protein [Phycisphaerae bacterium]